MKRYRYIRRRVICRALTLVEMLAVIVIVSMTVAVVAVSLAAADRGADILRLIGTIQELDFRGRLHARTSGAFVVLEINGDSRTLSLVSAKGELISTEQFSHGVAISFGEVPDLQHVTFDRQGRSEDYSVRIQTETHSRVWNVAGLTGLFVEVES